MKRRDSAVAYNERLPLCALSHCNPTDNMKVIQHWLWLDALCNSRPCLRTPQPKFAYHLLSITSVLLYVTKPLVYLITSNKWLLWFCVTVAQMFSCYCISLSYWTTIHCKHYCWRYIYVPRWMSLGVMKYRFPDIFTVCIRNALWLFSLRPVVAVWNPR